jgi:hypothetical protein
LRSGAAGSLAPLYNDEGVMDEGNTAVAVSGLLNEIDTHSGDAPAVVVNPNASPAALLAWARGQLRALRVMAVGCENQDAEHLAELPEAVSTLTEQVEAVLDVLGGKLATSKTRRGPRREQ